jgi:hypothetical protein
MKLIVEGPDGGGKSTFIERLGMDRLHLKSLRGGVGGTTQAGWAGNDDAPTAYARKLIESPDNTAFDRFYMSELVYGPMLRGQAAITSEEVTLVRRVERALGIPTVICLPTYGVTMINVMQDGRERPAYQTPVFLRDAYRGWQAMADRFLTHAHVFNYKADDLPTAQTLASWNHDPVMPPGVIGSPRATCLVVTTDDMFLPAFSMQDLAAATLNRALWYSGWREESLAFTNALRAHHSDGAKAALLPTLTTIIAVGQEATHQLAALGIENGAPNSPLVFTVADPRFTTLTNLTDTLKAIRNV